MNILKIKLLSATMTIILLSLITTAQAANIIVNTPNANFTDDGKCSIDEAIYNANHDSMFYSDCASGSGADTLLLTNDVILQLPPPTNDLQFGYTGTPTITSPLIINGQGHKIYRDNTLTCNINGTHQAGEFRLLHQNPASNNPTPLTLQNVSLENGCIDDDPNAPGLLNSRYGGAVMAIGPLYIKNVTFKNNQVILQGGAVSSSDIKQIESSSFIANFANVNGGAVAASGASENFTNNTFSGNTAGFSGGAVFLDSSQSLINVKNNTFYNNSAVEGGALYTVGMVSNLVNNVFSHNNASSTSAKDDCDRNQSFGNITLNGSNNISEKGNTVSGCPGLLTPSLGTSDVLPLANNGGSTMTHALTYNSSAVDKAINGTTTDQRGKSIYKIRDLGAYEVQGNEFCVGVYANNGFSVTVSTASELQFAIMCSNFNGGVLDTITLNNDITFSTSYEIATGVATDNATPITTSPLLIDGQGFSLIRDVSLTCNLDGVQDAGEFRLIHSQNPSLTLKNMTLKNGCADGVGTQASGGGVYNNGTLAVMNTTFQNNKALAGGAGIYHAAGTISEISNSNFSSNMATASAAAIDNQGIINQILTTIFSGNITQASGAAIRNNGTITLLSDSSFSANSATGSGAAIDNQNLISQIKTSTFSNNMAGANGGAIYNVMNIGTMLNNTFSGNSSATDGGAIYNNNTISAIENNTFSGNSAGVNGGAIHSYINTHINSLKNTLFHNNSSMGVVDDCYENFNSVTGNNNLSDKGQSGGCAGTLVTKLTSATVKALADNGGTTMTHGLQPGSEALDASVAGLSTDQRGLPTNGVRDIGAYEAQSGELCSPALQVDGFSVFVANVDELYTAMSCSKINGNNPDAIFLSNDITILFEYESDVTAGVTGTPSISTPLIIKGQNHIIQRDAGLSCSLNNTADSGEFRILRNLSGNSLTLQNLKLVNGCADNSLTLGGFGGGLFNEGDLTLINVGFNLNQAQVGGGLYHTTGTIAQVSQTTFSGNVASSNGAGLYNNSTITSIENSTFSGNMTSASGGGIFNQANKTIMSIKNSTFSGNTSATDGGAIYNNGAITDLRNSLFHNNTNTSNNTSNDCFTFGSGGFNGFNNMSDHSSGGCPGLLATILTTSTIGPLATYGGFTQTHSLLAGSEAWNAAGSGALTTDQRGLTVTDGQRDIGAIEDQAPVVTAPADVNIEATGPFTAVNNGVLGTATTNDPDQPTIAATNNAGTSLVVGSYTITWSATDNHGHSGNDTQNVNIVDTTPPTITLLGSAVILLNIGDTYIDAGAFAADIVDGNFATTVSNPVNTSQAGNYTITYNAVDNAGNNATQVTRLVKVQATIGGTVIGLTGSNTVTISDGTQSLVLSNGAYTFSQSLDSGSPYAVNIITEPADQTCVLSNKSGAITTSNISNIDISCGPLKYFIGGTASGLIAGNPVILAQDTQTLQVNNNGAFIFMTPYVDAYQYSISVDTAPTTPPQNCVLVNASGTIAGADVTNVQVNCTTIDGVFSDGFE